MIANQKSLVKKYFQKKNEEWESIYDGNDISSIVIQQREKYVLEFIDKIGLQKGAKILDLGCGAGLTSKKLLERGFDIFGIDVSENMITRAKNNCSNNGFKGRYKFEIGDAENLSFQDNSFDAVISLGLIEYLTYYRWSLQEIFRVIKPRGYLIVTVPNQIRFSYILDPIQSLIIITNLFKPVFMRLVSLLKNHSTLSFFRKFRNRMNRIKKEGKVFKRTLFYPSKFKKLLVDIDYEIIDTVSHGFGPFRILGFSQLLNKKANYILEQYRVRNKTSIIRNMGENYIVLCRKKEENINKYKKRIFSQQKKVSKFFIEEEKRLNSWQKKYSINAVKGYVSFDASKYKNKNVLVLSPHPDDEIIGCGGTLIKLIKSEALVTILQLTDGSQNEVLWNEDDHVKRNSVRLNEARNVADSLRIKELITWEEPDGTLSINQNNRDRLTKIMERIKPELILVPFINDPHPDHYFTSKILVDCLNKVDLNLNKIVILSYEVWSLVPINCYCNIDNEFFQKVNLLYKYVTAMKDTNYIKHSKYLASYQSNKLLSSQILTENYFNLNADEYKIFIDNIG
mgnify:CR=1 FL=1